MKSRRGLSMSSPPSLQLSSQIDLRLQYQHSGLPCAPTSEANAFSLAATLKISAIKRTYGFSVDPSLVVWVHIIYIECLTDMRLSRYWLNLYVFRSAVPSRLFQCRVPVQHLAETNLSYCSPLRSPWWLLQACFQASYETDDSEEYQASLADVWRLCCGSSDVRVRARRVEESPPSYLEKPPGWESKRLQETETITSFWRCSAQNCQRLDDWEPPSTEWKQHCRRTHETLHVEWN